MAINERVGHICVGVNMRVGPQGLHEAAGSSRRVLGGRASVILLLCSIRTSSSDGRGQNWGCTAHP